MTLLFVEQTQAALPGLIEVMLIRITYEIYSSVLKSAICGCVRANARVEYTYFLIMYYPQIAGFNTELYISYVILINTTSIRPGMGSLWNKEITILFHF